MIEKSEILEHVKEYLKKAKLMQIATTKNGQPWIAHSWFSHDDDLNFYFIGKKTRRHCQEFYENPKVACSIVQDNLDGLGQKTQGIMFEGVVEEASSSSLKESYANFSARWELASKYLTWDRLKSGATEVKLYKVTPKKLVWFDEVNYPNEPRNEIELN